jgi:hypothetical protein
MIELTDFPRDNKKNLYRILMDTKCMRKKSNNAFENLRFVASANQIYEGEIEKVRGNYFLNIGIRLNIKITNVYIPLVFDINNNSVLNLRQLSK